MKPVPTTVRNSSCASWDRMGNRVPEALVELGHGPCPTAEQVRPGQVRQAGTVQVYVATDAQGRLVVELPAAPANFNVYHHNSRLRTVLGALVVRRLMQPIPSRFTAELEAAWSVGGIIVDTAR